MSKPKNKLVECEWRWSRSPYFTDGCVYLAKPVENTDRLYRITDDKGRERLTLLDEPSGHFTWLPPETFRDEQRGRFTTLSCKVCGHNLATWKGAAKEPVCIPCHAWYSRLLGTAILQSFAKQLKEACR